jgi:hypothetical protein
MKRSRQVKVPNGSTPVSIALLQSLALVDPLHDDKWHLYLKEYLQFH